MEYINTYSPTRDLGFIAGLRGKQVAVYASSLAEAKQQAIEYFRPKKKDRGLLWVRRAYDTPEE